MRYKKRYKILDAIERIFGERPYYSYTVNGHTEYTENPKKIPKGSVVTRRLGAMNDFYENFISMGM